MNLLYKIKDVFSNRVIFSKWIPYMIGNEFEIFILSSIYREFDDMYTQTITLAKLLGRSVGYEDRSDPVVIIADSTGNHYEIILEINRDYFTSRLVMERIEKERRLRKILIQRKNAEFHNNVGIEKDFMQSLNYITERLLR